MPERSRDLFDQALRDRLQKEAPLAARMRPRTLDEFIGQEHIIGPGRLLRRAIQADQLSSLIFYGPPGTGKTTLATVIANTTKSHFITINAVLAGVADIRAAIADAQERRKLYNQRTILFVDEVHRFNKAQQDALLPWVENGTVILIGATTENPWFSVNRPLVSRSRIFQLKPLTEEALCRVAQQALADSERGYGRLRVEMHPDALDHIVNVSNGDARSMLNALELAVETTPPNADGVIVIDQAVAEDSIQRRAVLYDKEGDYHFDTISAFIKSLRGSDPDAALYWLAKMVYAGEDPRFIFRRMLIFAGEDVWPGGSTRHHGRTCLFASFRVGGLARRQFPSGRGPRCICLPRQSPIPRWAISMPWAWSSKSVRAKCHRTSRMPAATSRASATAKDTCTRTPTATTGSLSNTCQTRCRASCSISPAIKGTSAKSATPSCAGARPSWLP